MRIGVDLDEVVCQLMDKVIPILNEQNNTNYTSKDLTRYSLECIGLPDARVQEFLGNNREIYTTVLPVFDAKKYIKKLHKYHDIHFITSRVSYPDIMHDTLKWLKRHKIPFDGLHQRGMGSKHITMKNLQCSTMIDDNPYELRCIKAEIPYASLFLMDRPWNKTDKEFERVKNWNDFYRRVKI